MECYFTYCALVAVLGSKFTYKFEFGLKCKISCIFEGMKCLNTYTWCTES